MRNAPASLPRNSFHKPKTKIPMQYERSGIVAYREFAVGGCEIQKDISRNVDPLPCACRRLRAFEHDGSEEVDLQCEEQVLSVEWIGC